MPDHPVQSVNEDSISFFELHSFVRTKCIFNNQIFFYIQSNSWRRDPAIPIF